MSSLRAPTLGAAVPSPLPSPLHRGRITAAFPSTRQRVQQPGCPPATAAAAVPRCSSPHVRRRIAAAAAAAPSAGDLDVDVCILGAGILGLCTALVLLREDERLKVALVLLRCLHALLPRCFMLFPCVPTVSMPANCFHALFPLAEFACLETAQPFPSSFQVALVDREVPCAGATGAGQGYVWLSHREIGSPAFALAARSKQMWGELLAPAVPELSKQAVEWQVGQLPNYGPQISVCRAQPTVLMCWLAPGHSLMLRHAPALPQASGSMLLATSEAEGAALRQRRERLAAAGVEATALTAAEVHQLEPALATGAVHSGLLVPSDVQVSGKATAAALLRACEAHGSRFTPLFHEAAAELVTGPSGRVVGVATQSRRCARESRVVDLVRRMETGGACAAAAASAVLHAGARHMRLCGPACSQRACRARRGCHAGRLERRLPGAAAGGCTLGGRLQAAARAAAGDAAAAGHARRAARPHGGE